MSDISYQDRVAIITGAGGGLGKTYALEFAKRGAMVVVNDLGGAADGTGGGSTPADDVVKEITEAGGKAVANHDSVATPEGGEAIVKTALDNFGKVDIVIANAGILRDRMLVNMTEEEWDSVIQVHLKGTFAPSRHAAAHWRVLSKEQNGPVNGRIINTSSTAGLYGNLGQTNYGAAKAGVLGITMSAAREWGRYGIRVNSVCFGVVETEMTEVIRGEKFRDQYLAQVPMGRFSPPEEVAKSVCFLMSDAASYVTGQHLSINGGAFIGM